MPLIRSASLVVFSTVGHSSELVSIKGRDVLGVERARWCVGDGEEVTPGLY